jgi:hypothetical protein
MTPYNPPAVLAAPPPAVPIAESDNTDIIALRATIELLQLQKQTSSSDIQLLSRMRETVLADSARYVDELKKRARENEPPSSAGGDVKEDLLAPTLRYVTEGLRKDMARTRETERKDSHMEVDGEDSEDEGAGEEFPRGPRAQNVFRMPPINWAKYHVVGDALDKLHDEQRTRPTPGQPTTDATASYVMAAPYDPLRDANKSEHPMQTRKGTKKPM